MFLGMVPLVQPAVGRPGEVGPVELGEPPPSVDGAMDVTRPRGQVGGGQEDVVGIRRIDGGRGTLERASGTLASNVQD